MYKILNCSFLFFKSLLQPVLSEKDEAFKKIRSILSGEETIRLNLEFLYRNNNTDLLILKNTKVKY